MDEGDFFFNKAEKKYWPEGAKNKNKKVTQHTVTQANNVWLKTFKQINFDIPDFTNHIIN